MSYQYSVLTYLRPNLSSIFSDFRNLLISYSFILLQCPIVNKLQLLYCLTQMNKSNYDMPLQGILKRKIPTQNSVFSIQELISPIHTQQQAPATISSNYKYDLPCQRLNDQYLEKKYEQNRPCVLKSLYNDFSKFSVTTKTHENEVEKTKNIENQINYSNIRTKVSSIYERLLEQNKNKKKQLTAAILTQATFKPKQLSKQISNNRHHQSASALTNKRADTKLVSSNQSKNMSKGKKGLQHAKKLDFATSTKTKYQKILQQHFQPSNFNSKKNQFLTVDDVRLSKICGKNSVIMKLKQRLQPDFSSNKTRKQNINQKKNSQSQTNSRINSKTNNYIQKNGRGKQHKAPNRQSQSERQQLKHSQSEKWMQMNFYQRQDRIISNRKQKQLIGKQKQIQKQIGPCTFKPQLSTKCKSAKILQPPRHSYLQQYYQKLNRKY